MDRMTDVLPLALLGEIAFCQEGVKQRNAGEF